MSGVNSNPAAAIPQGMQPTATTASKSAPKVGTAPAVLKKKNPINQMGTSHNSQSVNKDKSKPQDWVIYFLLFGYKYI